MEAEADMGVPKAHMCGVWKAIGWRFSPLCQCEPGSRGKKDAKNLTGLQYLGHGWREVKKRERGLLDNVQTTPKSYPDSPH